MPVLGTKQFWVPAEGNTKNQQENQILKNSGYISLQLYSVNYMSKGNFFQRLFGGSDKITLALNLKYQRGVTAVEATSVQDIRKVKVGDPSNLALQRNVAVKIPATADAISMDVIMTAVENDVLQAKFDMLNKPEFQSALQLAPVVVGQVMTVTSLVKKLLSDDSEQGRLRASYAGIIGADSETNPVSQGRLTAGYLILIDTNDGNPFTDVDTGEFQLRGTSLYYKNEEVQNTYTVFIVSFDALKGEDQEANWFKKYNDGLSKLNDIIGQSDPASIQKIFDDSKKNWIEGNALLDADETYINFERIKIRAAAWTAIQTQYDGLTKTKQKPLLETAALSKEVFQQIIGPATLEDIREALPVTGNAVAHTEMTSVKGLVREAVQPITNFQELLQHLSKDVSDYRADLQKDNVINKSPVDNLSTYQNAAAYISAAIDVMMNDNDNFQYYYNIRRSEAANADNALVLINTYTEEDLKDFRDRIDQCGVRGRNEGQDSRVKCLCFVLGEIKKGNGGDIPVDQWQDYYNQLKCEGRRQK